MGCLRLTSMGEETTLLKVVYRAENRCVSREQGAKIIPLHVGVGGIGYGIGKVAGNIQQGRGAFSGKPNYTPGSRYMNNYLNNKGNWMAGKGIIDGGTFDDVIVTGNRIANNYVANTMLAATAVIAPLVNQVNVLMNEGIHEGGAYNRGLNKMSPYTLDKNWKLTTRNDLLQNNISYEDGMKLIDGTWNMTTLKFAPTNSILKNMAIKIPMKAGFKGAINFMNGW